MRIVFLNTLDGEVPTLKEFIAAERERDALFCFEEVYAHVEAMGRDLLPAYTALPLSGLREGDQPFHNAIYVPASYAVRTSGGVPGAYAQWVAIESNGSLLHLANVHDTAYPLNKRDSPGHIMHSKALIEFFSDKTPVIIGGDFNLLPDTESIQLFSTHGYRDLIREHNVTTTRNRLALDKYERKLYFADYVFTKGVSVKEFQVPFVEISDHLPLVLELGYS